MDENLLFALRLALLIGISLLAFFLTGIVIVRKDHVVIVSFFGHYRKTLTPGIYYYLPVLFQTSRQVPTNEIMIKINTDDGHFINVLCILKDARAYYEAHETLRKTVERACLMSIDKRLVKRNVENELEKNGFTLIEMTVTEP